MAVGATRPACARGRVDGEFWAGEDAGKETEVLAAALVRRPAEIVLPDTTRGDPALLARLQATGATLTFADPQGFAPRRASADLCAHFKVESLDAVRRRGLTIGLSGAAAAPRYLRATQASARPLTRFAAPAPPPTPSRWTRRP
jgi:hypothetical protein